MKVRNLLFYLAFVFILSGCKAEPWLTLFDGVTFNGWKASENADSWIIEEGAIVTNGPRSHLFYVGEDPGTPPDDPEFEKQLIELAGRNFPLIDLHVHLKKGLTMEMALSNARKYGFTDAMTWTNDKGKRMRLWIKEETEVGDLQDFMEQLVDIYVNPTYLPDLNTTFCSSTSILICMPGDTLSSSMAIDNPSRIFFCINLFKGLAPN